MNRDWHKDMELCKKASEGPWHFTDTEDVWMLFGGFNGHMQLIKAPKNSSEYAEYWPETDDAVFISETRAALPYWLQQYSVEKERADRAEEELAKSRTERKQFNQVYELLLKKFHETERLEQKLKEAIEHTISQYDQFDSKTIYSSLMVDYLKNVTSILYKT